MNLFGLQKKTSKVNSSKSPDRFEINFSSKNQTRLSYLLDPKKKLDYSSEIFQTFKHKDLDFKQLKAPPIKRKGL